MRSDVLENKVASPSSVSALSQEDHDLYTRKFGEGMKDRHGTDKQTGVKSVIECERFVHGDGYVLIGGEKLSGPCLTERQGQKLRFVVADCWAVEYDVYELGGKHLGNVR